MSEEQTADPPRETALPLVAGTAGNRSVWVFGGVMALVAAALFYALEARRSSLSSPALEVPEDFQGGRINSPPELVIPTFRDPEPAPVLAIPTFPAAEPPVTLPVAEPVRRIRRVEPPPEVEFEDPTPPLREVMRPTPRPVPTPAVRDASDEGLLPEPAETERKYLARFDNPSTTIPKGTVIHAVLESALDSTRPGAVRAIVSRDVSSFDGSRILIPKGSRLIGSYEAGLSRGQKRALVQWSRLMLPEGIIMELDSPSADPLGRAGIRGKVDSHFFARFGDALMRSILDVGVQVAGRQVGGDTVIVNLPNSGQVITGSQEIQPTLKVKHGTSVSVFVAHDLDFSNRFR